MEEIAIVITGADKLQEVVAMKRCLIVEFEQNVPFARLKQYFMARILCSGGLCFLGCKRQREQKNEK